MKKEEEREIKAEKKSLTMKKKVMFGSIAGILLVVVIRITQFLSP